MKPFASHSGTPRERSSVPIVCRRQYGLTSLSPASAAALANDFLIDATGLQMRRCLECRVFQIRMQPGRSGLERSVHAKPAASIMSPSKTRSGSFRDMQVDDQNHSVSLLDPELQKEPI